MPCAIRPERLAMILCGGAPAPDAAMLAQTRGRVDRAGFRLLSSDTIEQQGRSPLEPPGIGPLGGVLAAVRACENLNGNSLLIVPADMPLLNPRALQRLADVAEADGRGALFDLGPLPMALILSPRLRHVLLEAATRAENRSLTSLAERLGLPVIASLPDDGLDNLIIRRGARRTSEFAES